MYFKFYVENFHYGEFLKFSLTEEIVKLIICILNSREEVTKMKMQKIYSVTVSPNFINNVTSKAKLEFE